MALLLLITIDGNRAGIRNAAFAPAPPIPLSCDMHER